jgi:hypothetical protein
VEILRVVFSYAYGYATMELSSFCLDRGPSGNRADFDTILALSRTLPTDLPPDLAQSRASSALPPTSTSSSSSGSRRSSLASPLEPFPAAEGSLI